MKTLLLLLLFSGVALAEDSISDKEMISRYEILQERLQKESNVQTAEEKLTIDKDDIFVTCGKGIIEYKDESSEKIIEMPRWFLLKDKAGNYKVIDADFLRPYKVSVEMEGDIVTKIFDTHLLLDLKNEKVKLDGEVFVYQKIDCNCTDIIPVLMAEVIRLPKEYAEHNEQWKNKYKELKKRDKEHAERAKQEEVQWQAKYDKLKATYDKLKATYEEKIKRDDERLKAISNEHQYYIERYLERNNQK